VTSAKATHVTSASATTAPVSSASASTACLCSTRRKQRPG
jgi:hypothetical protein